MSISVRDEVIHFLGREVIGRAVAAAPVVIRSEADGLTTAYEEDVVYSNLAETSHGFSFDLTTLARGTRYTAEKHGSGQVAEGTMNSVRVIRYEMTKRRSTGEILGYARLISTTNAEDPLGGAFFLVRMGVVGDVLEVSEHLMGYGDIRSADGPFEPIAIDGTYRYRSENGALVVEYQQHNYHVDPHTLSKSPTGEDFPLQISREVVFPTPLDQVADRQGSRA